MHCGGLDYFASYGQIYRQINIQRDRQIYINIQTNIARYTNI